MKLTYKNRNYKKEIMSRDYNTTDYVFVTPFTYGADKYLVERYTRYFPNNIKFGFGGVFVVSKNEVSQIPGAYMTYEYDINMLNA